MCLFEQYLKEIFFNFNFLIKYNCNLIFISSNGHKVFNFKMFLNKIQLNKRVILTTDFRNSNFLPKNDLSIPKVI